MSNKIKLTLVDDHNLFREGVRKVLADSDYIEVVSEASNGREFLNMLPRLNSDVILMDISMPEVDGIEATRKAIIYNPDLKIIALSMYNDQEYYYKMIHAGVKGFVLKTSTKKDLETAIQLVYNGDCFFSSELLRNIIVNFTPHTSQPVNSQKDIELTNRESEVLQLLCKGLTNAEIADQLNVSVKTIDTHRQNLLSKTNTKTTVALVMFAIKNKIFEI